MRKNILAAAIFLVASLAHSVELPPHPEHFQTQRTAGHGVRGICSGVVDGDTIVVNTLEGPFRLRLHGVDAPERGQPVHAEATDYLVRNILYREVHIEYTRGGKAAWNRREGIVRLACGRDINAELVQLGLAIPDPEYCAKDLLPKYTAMQESARTAALGVWALENMVPPWEKRARDRRGATNGAGQAASPAQYVGNGVTRVFHVSACPSALAKNAVVPLGSSRDAHGAGYRACKRCRPR